MPIISETTEVTARERPVSQEIRTNWSLKYVLVVARHETLRQDPGSQVNLSSSLQHSVPRRNSPFTPQFRLALAQKWLDDLEKDRNDGLSKARADLLTTRRSKRGTRCQPL